MIEKYIKAVEHCEPIKYEKREKLKNKVYFFQKEKDAEYGAYVCAENWKQARNIAITSEALDDYEFIEITGYAIKENGKYILTDKSGELGPRDLLELGIDGWWWDGYSCDKCKKQERVYPSGNKMLCSSCIDDENEITCQT